MPGADTVLSGLGVSRGVAAGPILMLGAPIAAPAWQPHMDQAQALTSIARATQAVAAELQAAADLAVGPARAILETTAMMATDPLLVSTAQQIVRESGVNAARAVWEAGDKIAAQLQSLGGAMAERVADVADVRTRVVCELLGLERPGVPVSATPFVLAAADLAPADTATLDTAKVLAIVTAGGGPNSHTAILARSLGIPAVVGLGEWALANLNAGQMVVVDGGAGRLHLAPSEAEVTAALATERKVYSFTGPGQTACGTAVDLLANVGDLAGAEAAVAAGAQGIGLLRTEFSFLDAKTEPTVTAQEDRYREIFAHFPGKKVIVRTLDAGADKPLAFLNLGKEENPALGVRGFRTSLAAREVLSRQLQAIAAAAREASADVWVMAPMVSTAAEARDFVALCGEHGLRTPGVMIEVPAAAITAEALLTQCSFASIGTNDLVQYTMAADRELTALVPLADMWQPAVLWLIRRALEAGVQLGRPVGICGEAAADAAMAVVLVGLGARSLSMVPAALGEVATAVRAFTVREARELAERVLSAPDAAQARAWAQAAMEAANVW